MCQIWTCFRQWKWEYILNEVDIDVWIIDVVRNYPSSINEANIGSYPIGKDGKIIRGFNCDTTKHFSRLYTLSSEHKHRRDLPNPI